MLVFSSKNIKKNKIENIEYLILNILISEKKNCHYSYYKMLEENSSSSQLFSTDSDEDYFDIQKLRPEEVKATKNYCESMNFKVEPCKVAHVLNSLKLKVYK